LAESIADSAKFCVNLVKNVNVQRRLGGDKKNEIINYVLHTVVLLSLNFAGRL